MYRYMNMYTGEIYRNLYQALKTVVKDMILYPKCRTIYMLHLKRGNF